MKLLDINKEERANDYQIVNKAVERTEEGLRIISVMFNEHSTEKNSLKNIFWQKFNIYYKLSSIRFNYRILLEELSRSESYLLEFFKDDPFFFDNTRVPGGNPQFLEVERNLATAFDNIIFNSVSIFDYLGHAICYICKSNRQKTMFWKRLVESAFDQRNEISKLQIAPLICDIDSKFVCNLTRYRSRLIHRRRDLNRISASFKTDETSSTIKIIVSEEFLAKKHLKIIKDEKPDYDQVTLVYASSWIIKRTFYEIEKILDALVFEIKEDSHFIDNIIVQKNGKGIMSGYFNPISFKPISSSEIMWRKYKGEDLSWLNPKSKK